MSRSRRALLAATAATVATAGCLGGRRRRARDRAGPVTVRYADDPGVDAAAQSLDVYPAPDDGTGPGPVVVHVHGGGWVAGDRSRVHNKPDWLAAHGGVLVSANYRLSNREGTGARHPAHVEDVARAVAWALERAPEYGGDPDRLFATGHSAGAHLVALLATAETYLAATGHAPGDLAGAFPIDCALYDLPWVARESPARADLIEAAIGSGPAVRDASPVHRLDPGDDVPPIVTAFTDDLRRRATARFVARLRETGADPTVVDRTDLPGDDLRPHLAINRRIGTDGDPVTAALDRAIRSA